MSRLLLASIVWILASRLASPATRATEPGVTALTLEMHDKDHRPAGSVILYLIHEDGQGGYRVGCAVLRPDRSPTRYETRVLLPRAREWAPWGARIRRLWRSATIEPCAGIRSLLPRL